MPTDSTINPRDHRRGERANFLSEEKDYTLDNNFLSPLPKRDFDCNSYIGIIIVIAIVAISNKFFLLLEDNLFRSLVFQGWGGGKQKDRG